MKNIAFPARKHIILVFFKKCRSLKIKNNVRKIKVLSLFAHIEDHVLFGWPIMQDKNFKKFLVVCTNDGQGVLEESCNLAEVKLHSVLGCPNGFYRCTPEKDGSNLFQIAKMIAEKLDEAIKEIKPDILFTHNPWGEYGHIDHRTVFHIAFNSGLPVLITDIIAKSLSFPLPEPRFYRTLFKNCYSTVSIDSDSYKHQAALFKKAGSWTSNKFLWEPNYPPKTVKLYRIKK